MDQLVSMPLFDLVVSLGLASIYTCGLSISIIDKTATLHSFMDPSVSMQLFDLVVSLAAAAQMLSTLRGWMDGWID
jgi:hypothetical protein